MVTVSAVAAGATAIAVTASSAAIAFLGRRPMPISTPLLLGNLRAIMPRDLGTGRLPNPGVIADVGERRVERIDAVRHAGQIRMQRDRHHAARFRAFAIEEVELQ